MRPLRPAALPSDTSIRFLLLLAAVTSASLYLFQSLWFLVRGRTFLDVVVACSDQVGSDPVVTTGAVGVQLRAGEACRAAVSREEAAVALGGVLLVLLVAWGLYRAWPRWRERRHHLSAPDPDDGAALVDGVAALAEGAGVRPAPQVRIEATSPAVSGFAYGAGRDLRLGMGGGLVVAQVLDPPAFDAVVRHELGHVADRDVRWTYFAVSAWWSFVAVALSPVVASFAFRDVQYLLRLGWRTALLAALVALTITALLRTRELYADARALEWGSGPALDRLLSARPTRAGRRRPAALRLHPDPAQRRAGLVEPDLLFTASGWAALGAGLATGSAFASIADLSYLIVPSRAVALAAVLVAPLLAAVLCASAWRVALREVVRGDDLPAVLPLGLGAGIGLAAAPLLSLQAAVGGMVAKPGGWAGYALWAVGMLVVGLLLARWVCDTALLAVTAAAGRPAGGTAWLLGHVVLVSAVVAVWLGASQQALLLLSGLGPRAALAVPVWMHLPQLAFGAGPVEVPLALVALLLVLPVWAQRQLRGGVPLAGWFWRDRQPTRPGDLPRMPDAGRHVPPLRRVAVVGAGAGVVAGLLPLAVLVAGERLDEGVRTSDAFSIALGRGLDRGLLVAGLSAGIVAVLVLPRRWWQLALGSSLVAIAVAAAGAWLVMTANRYGLLSHSPGVSGPLGLAATRGLLARPAGEAAVPCALAVAAVASLRAALAPRAPAEAPTGLPPHPRATRPLLGALGAATMAGVLLLPTLGGVARLTAPVLAGTGVELQVPAGWRGARDPATGALVLVTIAEDVQVAISAVERAAPAVGGAILVGGAQASLVGGADRGPERVLVFEAATPTGVRRITVVGTPRALASRDPELQGLFAAVRWRPTG